jgi:hypothetical protein
MPDGICSERAKLERALIVAARNVNAVNPVDRGPSRRIARTAVKALQRHVEEHGCERTQFVLRNKKVVFLSSQVPISEKWPPDKTLTSSISSRVLRDAGAERPRRRAESSNG